MMISLPSILIFSWRRISTFIVCALILSGNLRAQCCSGGGGNPVAGGVSQGVLSEGQMEINVNYNYTYSNKFMNGDVAEEGFIEKFRTNYLYYRGALGITNKLTFSVEGGYYFDKTQFGLNNNDTIQSGGMADVIIFPRYSFLNICGEKNMTQAIMGLGWKIPVGKYNDSLKYFTHPISGVDFFVTKPPAVQPSTGSNDFLFYGFLYRKKIEGQMSFFSSLMYIRRGWNPNGEKYGDFASLGIFASRPVFDNFNLTCQVRGEWIGKIQRSEDLPMPAYDPAATGSKKVFFSPQLNYAFKNAVFVYVMGDIPLYQYVNGTQVSTSVQLTGGLAWRFMAKKAKLE